MVRQVFYSFHFKPDSHRVARIRNIGNFESNQPTSDQSWEQIKSNGDKAIKDWIARNMKNRSCVVVLIGKYTSQRYYVHYEINKAWYERRGVLGIHIHNLEDLSGKKTEKGLSPFTGKDVKVDNSGNKKDMDSIVRRIDPPYTRSQNVYNYIRENIENWIEEAIAIRNRYP